MIKFTYRNGYRNGKPWEFSVLVDPKHKPFCFDTIEDWIFEKADIPDNGSRKRWKLWMVEVEE